MAQVFRVRLIGENKPRTMNLEEAEAWHRSGQVDVGQSDGSLGKLLNAQDRIRALNQQYQEHKREIRNGDKGRRR